MSMDIYTLSPDDTTVDSVDVGINTSDTEPLDGGATTEEQSEQVPSWGVEASYSGQYAARSALALAEISGSVSMQPLAIPSVEAGLGGYYVATGATRDPRRKETERQPGDEAVSVDLARKGTRKTHLLAVDTSPGQPSPGHPFGNGITGLVGTPADARRVRIVDTTSSPTQRERPTPVATVEAEHGAIDLFDATSEAIDEPVYLYDLDYDLQGDVDPGVWDTYGQADITDADGVVAWGRVFNTGHEFDGACVLENGRIRLRIDEPTNADATASLEAERWERAGTYGLDYGADYGEVTATDDWVTQKLPASDWEPVDVDLTHIGTASIRAQVEFENTSTGDVYALNLVLSRGYEDIQFWPPSDDATPVPSGLVELLDPIAHASEIDTQQFSTLVARTDVRQ